GRVDRVPPTRPRRLPGAGRGGRPRALPGPGRPCADRRDRRRDLGAGLRAARRSAVVSATTGAVQAAPIWETLVGQRHVIETLDRAARGDGMTHAWLFTGPPGSGRSNAALAFA